MKRRPLAETLASLPPEYPEDLLPRIRAELEISDQTLLVLDDDPTGTQTVHDVPVLTEWSVSSLSRELRAGTPLLFLLTNSRSLPPAGANGLAKEIARNLHEAVLATGCRFQLISRSDSTLRGHYPSELLTAAMVLNLDRLPHLIIPFFAEGGRYTINDVHYVAEGDELVPAAETPFAQDASFGFNNSNLRAWVEEKTGGRVPADEVRSLGLDVLRGGDFEAVTQWLRQLPASSVGVVNAASLRDLEVFVVGLQEAEDMGSRFLFRTAASFVQARAGIAKRPLLEGAELVAPEVSGGGLIVVGSHVPKTTAQLAALRAAAGQDLECLELSVPALLADASSVVEDTLGRVERCLAAGRDVVLATSREVVTGSDGDASLDIAGRVSAALVEVVRRLETPPRFLVAKGGITSSDVATRGLGVKRAMVRGQILPGVPVWELGKESRFPGRRYVIFPGNVGGPDALLEAWQKLKSR